MPTTAPDREFRPDRPRGNIAERAVLGVVKTGGEITKGTAGLVSMAADAKLREADDFDAGKSPAPSNYTPIAERYANDPWYKRIPKQVNDAMHMSTSSPEVRQQVKHNSGSWASASRSTHQAIKAAADKEYSDADKTMKRMEPDLGTAGKVAHFASNLIPGVRALDVPLAIGEAKSLKGGIVPAIATAATKKLPGSDLARNAVQQAVVDVAPKFSPDKPPPKQNTDAPPATEVKTSDYFKPRKPAPDFKIKTPAGIAGARG